jgi:hypothetical protein
MVAVFAVYVVGFVMIYLTSFEMRAVALAVLIRKTQIDEPWRNPEWRKLASAFLGELSPPVEEPPADSSSQIQVTNPETLSKSIKENFENRMAPLNFQRQWQRWYEILKVRFQTPPGPQQAFANLYFSILNSLGWAGLIAAYISLAHVGWLSWAVGKPNPSLVKAIARAHAWYTRVLEGNAFDQRSLARHAGFTERYVGKVFSCAFLAPDIVDAILQGRQPDAIWFPTRIVRTSASACRDF